MKNEQGSEAPVALIFPQIELTYLLVMNRVKHQEGSSSSSFFPFFFFLFFFSWFLFRSFNEQKLPLNSTGTGFTTHRQVGL